MRKRERGVTIPMVAIFIPVILIIMGLAVDLGIAHTARTAAQSAADAGAMAGAFAYQVELAPQPVNDAVLIANQNSILGRPVSITAANVTLPTTGSCATSHCVTVTIPFTSPTFFAKIFGWSTISMIVNATAQSGLSAVGSYCTKPIFIPSSLVITAAPGTVLPDIRPTDPSRSLAPGDYYSLNFGAYSNGQVTFSDGTSDPSSGANTYRDAWEKCTTIDFVCGKYPIKTGNMVGPTGQGVSGADYTDIFYAVGNYGPNHLSTSGSLVTAPVWDSSVLPTTCTGSFRGANFCVNVIGFAQLFVNPYSDSNGGTPISAEFIGYTGCGGFGSGAGTGPFGAPVRLVQTP